MFKFGLPRNVKVINPGSSIEIHRAGWLIVNPGNILQNGYITVVDGTIAEVSCGNPGSVAPDVHLMDHGPGVIMPGLVNAHIHFELSALEGRINGGMPFNDWVRQVLQKREAAGEKCLKQEALKAMKGCLEAGTLFAGEISTLGITEPLFMESGIGGVWFREFLGSLLSPGMEEQISEYRTSIQGVLPVDRTIPSSDHHASLHSELVRFTRISLAGHAPHTSSPELLQKLKRISRTNSLPFSIHLAESSDETEFITTANGPWAVFLKERGIDFSTWPIPARSPVSYLRDLNVLDRQTLAVHLLNVDEKDLNIVSRSGAKPVVCPRSNMTLHGKLPDLPRFLKAGLMPALGTDSLASTQSLCMFDEMAFVAEQYPQIDPADILAMATVNGAMALGIEKSAGTLEPGRKAGVIYLPIHARHSKKLLETITGHKDT